MHMRGAVSAPSAEKSALAPTREELEQVVMAVGELVHKLRPRAAQKSDYAGSLALIVGFFEVIGSHDIATYFSRLGLALADAEDGIEDPLIGLKKKKSTRDITALVHGRMWVALAYECLRKTGLSHPAIAKEIAKQSSLRSLLRGKNASLRTSPKSWHDQFMAGEITNSTTREFFKQFYRYFGLGGNLSPERCIELANLCLERATDIAASLS